jgi:cytochrome c oxidase assembly factor CtaG
MDALTRALLLSWDLRIEVTATLFVLASLQILGWRRLRQRGRRRFANGWRLASYLSGLFLVGIALQSPIDVLSGQLFFMHMVQHLLLMMFAAPLLLLANPFPIFLWALPRSWRIGVGRWFQPSHPFYQALAAVTGPGAVWMIFVGVYLGWHDPNAYNLALRSEFIHDIEHITFFGVSLLFWWRVIGAGPQIGRRMSVPLRAAFAVAAVPPNMLAGIAISFATSPIYTHYTSVPRLYGISVMDDQTWSGLIMWIPGSMMFIIAAVVLLGALLGNDKKPVRSLSDWSTDENMIAPGLEHRTQHAKWRQAQRLRSGEV